MQPDITIIIAETAAVAFTKSLPSILANIFIAIATSTNDADIANMALPPLSAFSPASLVINNSTLKVVNIDIIPIRPIIKVLLSILPISFMAIITKNNDATIANIPAPALPVLPLDNANIAIKSKIKISNIANDASVFRMSISFKTLRALTINLIEIPIPTNSIAPFDNCGAALARTTATMVNSASMAASILTFCFAFS